MERKNWIRPTPAEVMSTWELPDIVEQTSAVGPVDAFRLFMAYAERALHHDFERELGSAFHFEACNAKEIQPNKEGHWIPSAAIRERITQEVSTALRDRIAPLLPGIHSYVSNRPSDPATVNRLAWMAEQIEAIPYALEGGALWRSREQPEGGPRDRKFEPMAWKELHDGLLEILNTATVNPGSTSAVRPVERIQWNDTAALLANLLTELIEAEYIIPPPNGRRTGRLGNRAAVADIVYQLMDIRDQNSGQPVSREYFRSLMRPSSPDRDSRSDLFRIRPRTARN